MKRIDAMRGDAAGVLGWEESVVIPTYPTMEPDKNPMFLEKRVYQGSSGRVYPLPFFDRVSHDPIDQEYVALHLENEYVYLMILPELGGRIHIGFDKTTEYDFFYRQEVIKPALVGLAGPWISGGVEFNWPQHHRPSTYMPCEWSIEHGEDGSVTIWLSEHEPMNRMKGMHGVCLRPNSNLIELKVRLYNRTPFTQTFLWWANVAARVHEQYQSFFPPDVHFVADHAKRATATFPHVKGDYYGVHYGERGVEGVPENELPANFVPDGTYAPDRLDWYANIPVPTSYMVVKTGFDFFGGYDHRAKAGFVHVADRHISPGKKQWTWGNHEFGYAWDRNLTETGGPYVELMAGVYTDNQPDFSYLAPFEAKSFSQFWYPIREIEPPTIANTDLAVSIRKLLHGVEISLISTRNIDNGILRIKPSEGTDAQTIPISLRTGEPERHGIQGIWTGATLEILERDQTLLEWKWPSDEGEETDPPSPATEPDLPSQVASNDELYLIGIHLEQYRHATRAPEDYWLEAIRRDPSDSRCHLAMGRHYLRRGMLQESENHLRQSIKRMIERNPNPRDGEALYELGLNLQLQARFSEAYDAFAKAAWNYGTKGAANLAMARLSGTLGSQGKCRGHLLEALAGLGDANTATTLLACLERKSGRNTEAATLVQQVLDRDPLDHGALYEAMCLDVTTASAYRTAMRGDFQNYLDLAWDYYWSGLSQDAIAILKDAPRNSLVTHTLRYFGDSPHPSVGSDDWVFANRLEDMLVLKQAVESNPKDSEASYRLGCFYYDRRRYSEAIECWGSTVQHDPNRADAWRNLGLAYFNFLQDAQRAKDAYGRAFEAGPNDARILYERDQLWKRLGIPPLERLAQLMANIHLVQLRDDLSLEICSLYNAVGLPEESQKILNSRQFAPWEGGEGQALGQHSRTCVLMSRKASEQGRLEQAVVLMEQALESPKNLGEARHLLANASDLWGGLGDALQAVGDSSGAQEQWTRAAEFRGDFQDMTVKSFSEMTYYRALALKRLGRKDESHRLLNDLLSYAKQLATSPAKIDYFATSLPTMLLFHEDIQRRQGLTAKFLEAQANLGLGEIAQARQLLEEVLNEDPNLALAQDLLQGVVSYG